MHLILRPVALALFLSVASRAADISSSGDWSESVTAANLVSGAGTDLQPQFESVSGATTLAVTNAPGAWSIRVRRSDSQAHPDVSVHVRRTSEGSGAGSISGGGAYVEVTGSDVLLCSGSEARSGISLQFKLSGLSKNVAPSNYLSSIIFTVQ